MGKRPRPHCGAFFPIGTFSAPGRDPRGRIVSNAYGACLDTVPPQTLSGGDAIHAKWFKIAIAHPADDILELTLTCEGEAITATLRHVQTEFAGGRYEILSSGDLAFDHAAILAAALTHK